MARKTIPVEDVKDYLNMIIRESTDEMVKERITVAVVIERFLMDTGNYHGFKYLPGVMDFTVEPPIRRGDDSRRSYY